jgi:hypothetical protein
MEKGTAGYMHAYKKKYGLTALGIVIVIAAMVVGIYLTLGTIKHLAVVVPILLSLPFAKIFILWVIVAKYKSIPKEDAARIEEQLAGREHVIILYDMALSSYESVSYAPCIVIDQGNIYLLWGGATQKEYTKQQQRDYVQSIVEKTGYHYDVSTVLSVDELIEQVLNAPVSDEAVSAHCERLKQRLLDVSV